MSASTILSILTILAAGAVAQNVNDKTPLFENLDQDRAGLNNALGRPFLESLTQWTEPGIPKFCFESATGVFTERSYCDPLDVEVFEAKYSDCEDTWQLCRCKNSTYSAEILADIAAQIPISHRQFSRTIAQWTMYPDEGGFAYAVGPDFVLIDGELTDENPRNTGVALHENAHNVDFNFSPDGEPISSSQAYIDAVNADSCVPDPYAQSNDVENFAQMSVVTYYDSNIGPMSRFGNTSCMSNQLNFMKDQFLGGEQAFQPFGGLCSNTFPRMETVCPGGDRGCGDAGATTEPEGGPVEKRSTAVQDLQTNKVGNRPLVPIIESFEHIESHEKPQEGSERYSNALNRGEGEQAYF